MIGRFHESSYSVHRNQEPICNNTYVENAIYDNLISKFEVETLGTLIHVVIKHWLKTNPPAVYIREIALTFNPKFRLAVFQSIAFLTKPNILDMPTMTYFQPKNAEVPYYEVNLRRAVDCLGMLLAGFRDQFG